MNFKINVTTNLEINSLEDLEKLRIFMEVNKLGKPNFTQLGRELGVDPRTAKKYYNGFKKKKKRAKNLSLISIMI